MEAVRVYLESFGCSANMADGERMLGCLEKAGFKTVSNPENAEVLIYNTCAVKGPTEDRMISLLKAAPKGKKLIVAGCLPLINLERLRREVAFDGIVGPAPTSEIVEAVERVLRGEKPVILRVKPKPEPDAPVKPLSPIRRIIVASYGCLGACSFCCVRFARGSLRSYSPEEVAAQVERAVKAGAKEIWLTSQDLSCYGLDLKSNLAELLERIVEVEGDFKVRVGMMNPNHLKPILGRVVKAFENPKIFKFVHIPVQSGSDRILRLMNRPYTSRDFEAIISAFRSRLQDLTVATDVICG
ncbi:MAG: MiaB/RimO family radical SAM methylthiotransferase, partial [Candidatus Hecatellales archaeon]